MTQERLDVTAKAFDVKHMERDILEAVYNLGWILGPDSLASQSLIEKYGEDDAVQQQVTVVMNWLVEERYLFPFYDANTGKVSSNSARGITPKGYRRLRELQHPIRTWVGVNWFAVTVAVITATIGIASMVVNLIINSD